MKKINSHCPNLVHCIIWAAASPAVRSSRHQVKYGVMIVCSCNPSCASIYICVCNVMDTKVEVRRRKKKKLLCCGVDRYSRMRSTSAEQPDAKIKVLECRRRPGRTLPWAQRAECWQKWRRTFTILLWNVCIVVEMGNSALRLCTHPTSIGCAMCTYRCCSGTTALLSTGDGAFG